MAREVAREPCHLLLEVGVGTGLALRHYPKDLCVWGIDLSPQMLARAARAPATPSAVALALMDAERLAFADSSFDCVTAPYVLSVTPNPEAMLREMVRVCRPGGRILVLNHFSGGRLWSLPERFFARLASRLGFRSSFSIDVIDRCGLTVESSATVNLLGLSRLVVIRKGHD